MCYMQIYPKLQNKVEKIYFLENILSSFLDEVLLEQGFDRESSLIFIKYGFPSPCHS